MTSEFKVMDERTGLYSTGGYDPQFNERGKNWKTAGQVRSHLKLYARGQARSAGRPKRIPASWVVVEFTLKEASRQSAASLSK